MLISALPVRLFLSTAVFAGAFLGGCALNFEDPEEELRETLEKSESLTLEKLQGLWQADSGLTGNSKSVKRIETVNWEVLRDGSFYITDPEGFLFPEFYSGQLDVSEESLVYNPENNGTSWEASTRLTRLGTRLEIKDASREKTVYFDKQTIANGKGDASFFYENRATLWELKGWRESGLLPVRPDTAREFYYLRFVGDTVWILANVGGLVSERMETWTLGGDTLSWGDDAYPVDPIASDSLRLWSQAPVPLWTPLNASGNPGYWVFKKVSDFHPNYRDLNFLMDYWRSDVWQDSQSHYGRYYDLEFSPGGKMTSITNLGGQPDFTEWEYTGGVLSLTDSDGNTVAATLETTEPGQMSFSSTPGSGRFTQIDPQLFASDPLKRFSDRSYLHLNLGSETLRFYWNQTRHTSGDFDKLEMAAEGSGDSLYAFWTSHPEMGESRLVTSRDKGFAFAVAIKDTGSSYRWLYADTASGTGRLVSIRSQFVDDTDVVEGTLSSGQIVDDNDSVYTITGQFRYRQSAPESQNPLWDVVPTVR